MRNQLDGNCDSIYYLEFHLHFTTFSSLLTIIHLFSWLSFINSFAHMPSTHAHWSYSGLGTRFAICTSKAIHAKNFGCEYTTSLALVSLTSKINRCSRSWTMSSYLLGIPLDHGILWHPIERSLLLNHIFALQCCRE